MRGLRGEAWRRERGLIGEGVQEGPRGKACGVDCPEPGMDSGERLQLLRSLTAMLAKAARGSGGATGEVVVVAACVLGAVGAGGHGWEALLLWQEAVRGEQ